MTTELITELERLFQTYGDNGYGEGCTKYEHMAQCAWWAEQKGYANNLIAAAFLHDIGHMLAEDEQLPELDEWGYAQHDELGTEWLREFCVADNVCQPIALHVQAKRYLVATNLDYAKKLSCASQVTLSQQGGPFSQEECIAFAASAYFEDAIRLREIDELGKSESFDLPPLQYWLGRLPDLLGAS